MRAVDTNVLVRLITRDDRKQAESAVIAVEMLLNHQHLTIQEADVVATALENFRKRPTVSFTDNLIVEIARKSGHIPVGTFDRNLAKLEGTERL
jgi:predicted nucleic-acid-binding protein